MVADSRIDELADPLPDELSVDTVLSLFEERRRRLIVKRLNQHDVALPQTDDDEVISVYLNLYHNDIPRMVDHGVVE